MKDEIKNKFQESYENFDSPVDNTALLAGIADKTKPEKKKRRAIFWLFPMGLLLITGAFFIFSNGIKTKNTSAVTENQIPPEQQQLSSTTPPSTNPTKSVSEKNSIPSIPALSKTPASPTVEKSKPSNKANKKQESSIQNSTPHSTTAVSDRVSHTLENSKTQTAKPRKQTPAILPPTQSTTEKNTQDEMVGSKPVQEEETPIIIKDLEFIKETPQEEKKAIPTQVAEEQIETVKESENTPVAESDITTESRSFLTGVKVKLVAGGSLPSSSFLGGQYSEQRAEALSSGFGYGAELSCELLLRGGWVLSAGLDYDRYYNLLEWEGSYIVDKNGEYVAETTETLQSSMYSFVTRERKIGRYNVRSFMDVPLSVGYRKDFGRMSVQPSFLVAFNLLQRQEGYALNENGIPQDLGEYSFSVSPKLGGAVDVSYELINGMEVVSRLSYTKRMIKDGVGEEVLTAPELSVGLRYGF